MSVLQVKRGPWINDCRSITVDGWSMFQEERVLGGCSYRLHQYGALLHESRRSYSLNRAAFFATLAATEKEAAQDTAELTFDPYWDCECSEDYIHPKTVKRCKVCGARESEQPDSHIHEVVAAMKRRLR